MLELLNETYRIEYIRGGYLPKLSILDKLATMLSYYCNYRIMENTTFDYAVSKSTICESVKWVEDILIKSKDFSLPKKRELINNIDIKGKKDIPLKAQIITDEKNLKILNVSFSSGKTYNFKLFKYSKIHFLENALIIADSGYLGINSLMLKKSLKKYKLIKEDKEYNLSISKCRIYIKYINRNIKKFRIISTHYRNKRNKIFL